MTTKLITYKELKIAIEVSFMEDNKIFEFFDPNVEIETLSDIVENILMKVNSYENAIFHGVYEGKELIGYFAFKEGQLISFGLNVNYRIRKYLRSFFSIIRSTIKGHFMCILWSRNIRAIKFLIKNKMEVIKQTELMTQLAI